MSVLDYQMAGGGACTSSTSTDKFNDSEISKPCVCIGGATIPIHRWNGLLWNSNYIGINIHVYDMCITCI